MQYWSFSAFLSQLLPRLGPCLIWVLVWSLSASRLKMSVYWMWASWMLDICCTAWWTFGCFELHAFFFHDCRPYYAGVEGVYLSIMICDFSTFSKSSQCSCTLPSDTSCVLRSALIASQLALLNTYCLVWVCFGTFSLVFRSTNPHRTFNTIVYFCDRSCTPVLICDIDLYIYNPVIVL